MARRLAKQMEFTLFSPFIPFAKDQSLFKINSLRDQRLYHSKKEELFHSVILYLGCLFRKKEKEERCRPRKDKK